MSFNLICDEIFKVSCVCFSLPWLPTNFPIFSAFLRNSIHIFLTCGKWGVGKNASWTRLLLLFGSHHLHLNDSVLTAIKLNYWTIRKQLVPTNRLPKDVL